MRRLDILLRNLLGSRVPLSIRGEILPYVLDEKFTGHIKRVKTMIKVSANTREIDGSGGRSYGKGLDMTEEMTAIAGIMLDAVEENFEKEGRQGEEGDNTTAAVHGAHARGRRRDNVPPLAKSDNPFSRHFYL